MKFSRQVAAVAGFALFGALMIAPAASDARGRGFGRGGGGQQGGMSTLAANLPMQDLSPSEEASIAKMREEEKLARDVYRVLYDKWQLPVFAKISQSEQRHMDAVKILLDKYTMQDPARPEVGVFTDPALQELYNSLTARGMQSAVDALHVGATIEDLDIKDLYDQLAQTDNRDIKAVYQNLAKGSRNHLRAFSGQLSRNGIAYEAQFLSPEQITEIITSPRERGRVDEYGNLLTGRGGGRGRMSKQAGAQCASRFLTTN